MIEKEEEGLSIVQQCILLSIYRSGIYYQPVSESELDLKIMLEIDKYYTLHPFYGTRRMSDYLKEIGHNVGRKAVRSYYIKMGIWAIYPKKIPNTSEPNKEHKIYPYLLRKLQIIMVPFFRATKIKNPLKHQQINEFAHNNSSSIHFVSFRLRKY